MDGGYLGVIGASRNVTTPKGARCHERSQKSNPLGYLGCLDEAIESYHRALSILPDCAEAHWKLSLLRLLMGNFARGW